MSTHEVRRVWSLLALGARWAVTPDPLQLARNVAIVVATLTAVTVLGAAWGLDPATRVRGAADLAAEPLPAGASSRPGVVLPDDASVVFSPMESRWGNSRLEIIHLASDGPLPDRAFPPGVRRWPAAGEMVVSSRLDRLLAEPEAAARLRNRLPGEVVDVIDREALVEPSALLAYVGVEAIPDELGVPLGGWGFIPTFTSPRDDGQALFISIASAAALVPLAFVLAAALRIGSDRREQRFAALSLIGARQRDRIWAQIGETLPLVAVGWLAGLLILQPAARLALATLPPGYRFDEVNLQPGPARATLLMAALILVATAAAVRSIDRETNPLERARITEPRVPGRHWLVAPAAGLAGLLYTTWHPSGLLRGEAVPQVVALLSLAAVIGGLPVLTVHATRTTAKVLARSEPLPLALAGERLARGSTGSSRLAGLVALLVFAAAMPHALLPLISAARGLVTTDEVVNVDDAVTFTHLEEPVAPLRRTLSSLGTVATATVTTVTGPDDRSAIAWIVDCGDLPALLLKTPPNCSKTTVWSVDAEGETPLTAGRYALGSDQRGEATIGAAVALPRPEPWPYGFPRGLAEGRVLIVPTAALDTDTALALTDDPHRSRLVVIHNDDPELVRDQLWPYRSGYREGGSTLTPAELVYDDERNLLYLAQVVRLALGVGFAQAAIGVVLAAVAASAEQRHTVVAQWAIGVPRRTTLAAHIVTLVLPTFLASMIGAAAGLGVGTLYLSYADAADSPLHSGPLYGFDLGGLAGWTTLAIVVMGVATLAAAPIVFARPDIAELRAE